MQKTAKDIQLSELKQFYGTNGYHGLSPLHQPFILTDGARYVAERAWWMVSDPLVSARLKGLYREDFLSIKYAPNGNGGATLTIEDGNYNVFYRQEYEFVEVDLEKQFGGEAEFFVEPTFDPNGKRYMVVMLPSER